MRSLKGIFLAGVLALSIASSQASSDTGKGKTTRYWDCCKTSCAWSANTGSVSAPARSCSAVGNVTIDANTQSGCNGGDSYVCNDQSPFVKDGQAYGFAAGNVNGHPTNSLCCACYKLTFTSTAISGKNLIVQVINTGSDLDKNQFDLQIPGGGWGIFTAGCPKQWPHTPAANWGAQYGGVKSRDACSGLPACLVAGCQFRFDWFQNADNPTVDFTRVQCPAALTEISKCKRNDDSGYPEAGVTTYAKKAASKSPAKPKVAAQKPAAKLVSKSPAKTKVAAKKPAAKTKAHAKSTKKPTAHKTNKPHGKSKKTQKSHGKHKKTHKSHGKHKKTNKADDKNKKTKQQPQNKSG